MSHQNRGGGFGTPGNAAAPPGALPPGFQQGASLNMTNFGTYARQVVPHVPTHVMLPSPALPFGEGIVHQMRRRVYKVSGVAANATATATWRFDKPTIAYAISGAAITVVEGSVTDKSLNHFRINFTHNASSEKLDSESALGGALVGTAENPAPLGLSGWRFDNGGILEAPVVPLIDDLYIDLVVWVIEVLGAPR